MSAAQVQSDAEQLAAEIKQIEDRYGPGEKARTLIRRATEGYDVDTNLAALFLLPPFAGPWTGVV